MVALEGPLFVMVIVNMTVSPSFGEALLTDLASERSACGVSVSVGVTVGVAVCVGVDVCVAVAVAVNVSVTVAVTVGV